jgi:transcriptional regulator GlxA family with amidase domain
MANRLDGVDHYTVETATVGDEPILCSSGLRVVAADLASVRGPIDTLLVAGGRGHERAARHPVLVAEVRRLARTARRVVGICTGASVLAAAGLLDGRRATTHWAHAEWLAETFPRVEVDPEPVYVRDGDVFTSAGVLSGLDLTLALIEEDCRPGLARDVARQLVAYVRRQGNAEQISMYVAPSAAEHDLVRRMADHIQSRPADDLSTAALADRFGLSTRHLSRLFNAHMGMAPARYVRRSRTEAAANLLQDGVSTLDSVARRCGFGSAQSLRGAFRERYGMSPSEYRLHMSADTGTRTAARAAAPARAGASKSRATAGIASSPSDVPAHITAG